jgi:(1->4)-alpha-D-glucan 1-alpha-D-glucosylmutase
MSELANSFTPLRATRRLQFRLRLNFRGATQLVPYLAALGASHIQASPIMEARPGATHGYDMIDHADGLDPERANMLLMQPTPQKGIILA